MEAHDESSLPPLTPPPDVSTAPPVSEPPFFDLGATSITKLEEAEEVGGIDLFRALLEAPPKMINTRRINALLSLNVDANANHFVMFLNNGTLLAHDEDIDVPQTRSFAALVGLTWRRHASQLISSDHFVAQSDVQHVKTLQLFHKRGKPKELKTMIVEWEGIVASVEEVKDRVLLAAQRTLEDFSGDEDEAALGKRFLALKLAEEKKRNRAEEKKDRAAEISTDKTAAAKSLETAAVIKGDKATNDHKGDGSPEQETKPNKVEILQMRAEALAKAIVEEWPEPIPEDFY